MQWKNFISSIIGGLVSGGLITAISNVYIIKYQNDLSDTSWKNQHSIGKSEKFFEKKVDILSEYVSAISETLDLDISSGIFVKKEILKKLIQGNDIKFNSEALDELGLPNAKDLMAEEFLSNKKLKKYTDLIRLYYGHDIFLLAKDILNKLYYYGNPEFDPNIIYMLNNKIKALKEKKKNSLQDFILATKSYISMKGYPPELSREIDILESKMMDSIEEDMSKK